MRVFFFLLALEVCRDQSEPETLLAEEPHVPACDSLNHREGNSEEQRGSASREAFPTSFPSFSRGLSPTPAPESGLASRRLFSPGLQSKVCCHSNSTEKYWGGGREEGYPSPSE